MTRLKPFVVAVENLIEFELLFTLVSAGIIVPSLAGYCAI